MKEGKNKRRTIRNKREREKMRSTLKIEEEIMRKDEDGLRKVEENHRRNIGNTKKSMKLNTGKRDTGDDETTKLVGEEQRK